MVDTYRPIPRSRAYPIPETLSKVSLKCDVSVSLYFRQYPTLETIENNESIDWHVRQQHQHGVTCIWIPFANNGLNCKWGNFVVALSYDPFLIDRRLQTHSARLERILSLIA